MQQILSFYRFFALEDPQAKGEALHAAAVRFGLLGTILVAKEGLNCVFSGEDAAIDVMAVALRGDPDLEDVAMRRTLVPENTDKAPPFKKLEMKVKRWIIRFADDEDPSLDAILGGARLSPEDLDRLLAEKRDDLVLVDTRNAYEVEAGTFAGAKHFPIERFSEFPEAFAAEADPSKTYVFFCTGGVRCEKVVPWARKAGFAHSFQLDGGILGYLAERGQSRWQGDCFVFDGRRAVGALDVGRAR